MFKKAIKVLGVSLVFASGLAGQSAMADVIKLTSLEWPPYSGAELPGQGETVVKLREILEKAGHTLEVEFLPWKRAVNVGMKNPAYSGYFPEYPVDSCKLSDDFDKSEVGFAIAAGNPQITWGDVSELSDLKFAVVSGYANDSGPFDAAVEAGSIKASKVNSDGNGLKLSANGRVDASVVDKKVMGHLLDTELPEFKDKLVFNDQVLKVQTLHVCLQDHPQAQLVYDAIKAHR